MSFWPRGVRRNQADEWIREIAPSRELVLGFKHQGIAWSEFARRYSKQLSLQALEDLRRRAKHETITLLYGCMDENRCHRGLLRTALQGGTAAGRRKGRVQALPKRPKRLREG